MSSSRVSIEPPPLGSSPKAFDGYHKWLGIPPEEQPPNHYRLLAIPPFTTDLEVVEHAARQRLLYLSMQERTVHGEQARQLVKQLQHAKDELISPARREIYDLQLSAQLHGTTPQQPSRWKIAEAEDDPPVGSLPVAKELKPIKAASVGPASQDSSIDVVPQFEHSVELPRERTTKPASSKLEAIVFLGGIVVFGFFGLMLGYVIITSVDQRHDFLHLFTAAPASATPVTPPLPTDVPTTAVTPEVTPVKPAPIEPAAPKPVETPNPMSLPATSPTLPPSIPSSPANKPSTPEPKPMPPVAVEEPKPMPTAPEPMPMPVELSPAEKLASALAQKDLTAALNSISALATEKMQEPTAARLEFLTGEEAQQAFSPETLAKTLAAELETAATNGKQAIAAQYIDRLLILARQLNDRDLVRRATLLAVKLREGS